MLGVKNYKRNKRNSFVPTKTVCIRAEVEFLERLTEVAKSEGLARNGFIIKILTEYMDGRGSK